MSTAAHPPGRSAGRIDWAPVIGLIDRGRRFHVLTHVNPDGDALGSQLGLRRFLEARGKEVVTTGCEPVPARYAFLDRGELSECRRSVPAGIDAVFLLDAGEWTRIGCPTCPSRDAAAPKVYIDHHPLRPGVRADQLIVVPSFSSTAEMVLDLVLAAGGPLTRAIAEPLYVGLVTDTGLFSYRNASPDAHRAAATLLEAGADARTIHAALYEGDSAGRLRLEGEALRRLRLSADGRLAWLSVSSAEMTAAGVPAAEMEGFVDLLRPLGSADVFVAFWETSPGRVRASVRSRGDVPVNDVAETLGGGGHPFAAGFEADGDLEEVVRRAVAAFEALLACEGR